MKRQLLSLAALVAGLAASAAIATAETVGAFAVGAWTAVRFGFLALVFMPASVAQLLGFAKAAAKLERWGRLAEYRVGMYMAVCKELLFCRFLEPLVLGLGMRLHMAFPSTVTADIGFGIIGELAFDGPCRTQPARINHGTAADIVVGRWFTLAADGTARPGGAGAIGGVFMNPKNQASLGTAGGGSLAPTLTVPTGTIGEFCYMGAIIVSVGAAVAIGNPAKYDTTTGVIGVGAPGAGEAAVPNSKFIRYANAAAGLAVLELTN